MSQLVFIMDVDGVLVNPFGYRKATQATLDWFTRRIGVSAVEYTEAISSQFEAHNISSEFDIVPLCLAEIFDQLLAAHLELQLPADIYQACDQLHSMQPVLPQVDFTEMVHKVEMALRPGLFPSDSALHTNQSEGKDTPFPHLKSHPLLNTILSHTRDVRLSPITPLFQQFVLGSKIFKKVYSMPTEVKTISLLKAFDQPLLDRELAKTLMKSWVLNEINLVAYTGRPSRLPSEALEPLLSYSPEADLALKIVDLGGIPLVGFGQTYRLAKLTGGKSDQLGKPSLISALGAIGAAVSKDSIEALMAADRWVNRGENSFFRQLPAMDIHLFEDTAGSIHCVKQAAAMLNDLGIETQFHAWGIARTATKTEALQSAGAQIQGDINSAIRNVMSAR